MERNDCGGFDDSDARNGIVRTLILLGRSISKDLCNLAKQPINLERVAAYEDLNDCLSKRFGERVHWSDYLSLPLLRKFLPAYVY